MSGDTHRRRFSLRSGRRTSPPPAVEEPAVRWQAARLAALGTGLATLSHDLRGALSPALLAAERLQGHADPQARRTGDVLVRAVERAMALLREQLGPLRQGLPEAAKAPVSLADVIAATTPPDLAVEQAATAPTVTADPDHLREAWSSLFAYTIGQGASRANLATHLTGRVLRLTVEHDGRPIEPDAEPGHPETDWHLAIATELLRACGGTLTVDGCRLTMTLRPAPP